jgi:hypothetical protein
MFGNVTRFGVETVGTKGDEDGEGEESTILLIKFETSDMIRFKNDNDLNAS